MDEDAKKIHSQRARRSQLKAIAAGKCSKCFSEPLHGRTELCLKCYTARLRKIASGAYVCGNCGLSGHNRRTCDKGMKP